MDWSIDDGLFRKIVFVSVILVLASVGSASAVDVSSCQLISSPGVYVLSTSITNSGATKCIEITSSDVVFDGQDNTIDGTGSNTGIYVKGSTTLTNVTVKNTAVTQWNYGIYYENVGNGAITSNTVSDNNKDGISLYSSSGNTIQDNTASNNGDGGIYLESSSGNTVTGNAASDNNVEGIALYLSSNNDIDSNTITGNSNATRSYGGIALLKSTGNTITGNVVSGEKCDGIALWDSSNGNIITGNTVSDDGCGGIYLESSSSNTIEDNTLSNNAWEGISINSSSNNNIIKDNTVSDNSKYGIYLESSSSNTIHNNNLDNINDAHDDGSNTWNTTKIAGTNIVGGSYLGGNYYSDYAGSDADGDGIGDTSYIIPGGSSIDSLPLIKVSTPLTTTPSPSNGGGGGGGAATSFEVWIKDVLKGQTFELDIDDEDILYINGLSLTAKQDIYSSKLSITDYDKKPWSSMEDPDASVYRFFKVDYDKNTYVESATLKFSIKKSWLKENNINPYKFSMYRYTTTWEELDSEILKEDDENIYLEATTPGFSYFSLGGANDSGYRPIKEDGETPSVTTTTTTLKATTTTTSTVTPAPQGTTPPPDTKPPAKGENGGICGPTTILLISMMCLLLFRGMRSKQ